MQITHRRLADQFLIMNNLKQTTLSFERNSPGRQAVDALSSSPRSTSKASTPKTSSSSYSSKSAPTNDEREHLRQLARNTLITIERGGYVDPSGNYVNIRPIVEASLKGTLFYFPNAFDKWETSRPVGAVKYVTEFRVREVTTLQAAKEFTSEARKFADESDSGPPAVVGVLNFASATKVSSRRSRLSCWT
jgi:Uncharacterized protein conserved in bacteria (DUF2263)